MAGGWIARRRGPERPRLVAGWPRGPPRSGRLRGPGVALAAIVVAAGIAYAPSFGVPFQFDDEARLLHNMPMQQGGLLDALHWLGNTRIVPSLTLVLNYRLGGF